MKGSDLLVRSLEEEGVEYVFGVPGEENIDMVESLRTSSIKLIVTRHEQAAAFMAATYGRLTGRPGVCLSTLGPGATNLVTGIAYAQLGGMPLVAITGQKPLRENWQADFQILDIVHMMEPITKRTVHVHQGSSIPKEVREAFKLAMTERLGACHIEIPEDVAEEEVDPKYVPQSAVHPRRPSPDIKSINEAVKIIMAAKDPILVVSSRGQRNRVKRSLQALSDSTGLYVISTQLGKGVMDPDHPNTLWSFGIHKRDYVNRVVEKADLLVTIGYSTVEHPPYVWNKDMDKNILHIDFTPAENDIFYSPTWEVIGDIATSLEMIREELQRDRFEYRSIFNEEVKKDLQKRLFEEEADNGSFPMHPRRIVSDARRAMGKKDILTLDNGIYKMWFSRHYKAYDIGTFLLDNTLATMGAGLPSAIAAKMVNPDKNVMAVVGDGGFMMNSQELETAVRLGLNIVVLILNDNGFGFIKWKQMNRGLPQFGLDLGNPDFVKYAESYGAKGHIINSANELLPTLKRAMNEMGPSVVVCPIDYSENMKVWSQELDSIKR